MKELRLKGRNYLNIRMYFQLKILTKNEPQNCPKRKESVKLPPKMLS